MRSLEERVLRILYEGTATASDCAAELQRCDYGSKGLTVQLEALLTDLARRSYLEVHNGSGVTHYRLTAAGSERLASLVERME